MLLSQKSLLLDFAFVFHLQQAEEMDAELLMFPSQLENIGLGARWLPLVYRQ